MDGSLHGCDVLASIQCIGLDVVSAAAQERLSKVQVHGSVTSKVNQIIPELRYRVEILSAGLTVVWSNGGGIPQKIEQRATAITMTVAIFNRISRCADIHEDRSLHGTLLHVGKRPGLEAYHHLDKLLFCGEEHTGHDQSEVSEGRASEPSRRLGGNALDSTEVPRDWIAFLSRTPEDAI